MTSIDELVQRLDGHDGSHWQPDAGPIDYDALFNAVWWLGWKISQSIKYRDPSFDDVRAHAQVAIADGRLQNFLPYHWLSSTTDPVAQADWYLAQVGSFLPHEGAMLDAEEKGITEEKCLAWLERVEDRTHRPSDVYTGLYVADGTIYRSPRIRSSKYGPRPIHLAAYVPAANVLARMTQLGVQNLPLHAWQYSSNGPVPGIVGRADMNSIIDPAIFNIVCGVAPKPPLPPLTPLTDITMEDNDVNVSKIRFDGYANQFMFTGSGYTHLSQKLADEKLAGVPLEVVDAHPLAMLAAATQNGMRWDDNHQDWFDVAGGKKPPTYI